MPNPDRPIWSELRWTYTRNFTKKQGQARFLQRLDRARNLFPELEGRTIKVGITLNVDGKADLIGMAVYFRSRNISYYVMGHELTHLVQQLQDLPKTERSCDILTLARSKLFCDQAPYYVKVPKDMLDDNRRILPEYRPFVHRTAKTAMDMMLAGKKNYIKWFEKSLVQSLQVAEEDNDWIMNMESQQSTLDEFIKI